VKAIIIGGGIGGLATAIALERIGIQAHVYERAGGFREVGAGISLWANAIRALDLLGLGDAVRACSLSGLNGELRTWRGTVLSATSYEELVQRFGAAIAVLHRSDLLQLLVSKIDGSRLHTNRECIGFDQDVGGVRARLAGGQIVDGDLLIGADGLRSVIRQQLFGASPPRYAGYTAWRAVVTRQPARLVPGESWGIGQRFGIVPMTAHRVYWFATKNAPEGERDPEGCAKRSVLELFRGWHEPVEELIGASEESSILRNDIYDRDPLERWSEGRITLLGDAAHPMTPNLGQGACQAIEDAIVVAASLKHSKNAEAGLGEYERRRIPRTAEIVLQSRRLGQFAQWEDPLASGLRNLAIRAMPDALAKNQIQRIVGYDVSKFG
jgi:2-polyprenyl-6-methoxyphenol hydroxylase-like FAD-dependent oxidoreductase